MGVRDANYQIIYAGEPLPIVVPGGLVFFQRAKEFGGGWWLGWTRTDPGGFEFAFNYPISLSYGLFWVVNKDRIPLPSPDDFELTG